MPTSTEVKAAFNLCPQNPTGTRNFLIQNRQYTINNPPNRFVAQEWTYDKPWPAAFFDQTFVSRLLSLRSEVVPSSFPPRGSFALLPWQSDVTSELWAHPGDLPGCGLRLGPFRRYPQGVGFGGQVDSISAIGKVIFLVSICLGIPPARWMKCFAVPSSCRWWISLARPMCGCTGMGVPWLQQRWEPRVKRWRDVTSLGVD